MKSHDKYGVGQDPYTLPNSIVLRNKLFIESELELFEVELQITALAALNIPFKTPPYDLKYWQLVHKQLFSSIFEWAGELRTVIISKGGTNFGLPQGIER